MRQAVKRIAARSVSLHLSDLSKDYLYLLPRRRLRRPATTVPRKTVFPSVAKSESTTAISVGNVLTARSSPFSTGLVFDGISNEMFPNVGNPVATLRSATALESGDIQVAQMKL